MAHERQTLYWDITLYIDRCECCPYCEEKIVFKSVIDERYDKVEKWCNKIPLILHNTNMIPIECPLPPRYSE